MVLVIRPVESSLDFLIGPILLDTLDLPIILEGFIEPSQFSFILDTSHRCRSQIAVGLKSEMESRIGEFRNQGGLFFSGVSDHIAIRTELAEEVNQKDGPISRPL
jgi:hypothetical protein